MALLKFAALTVTGHTPPGTRTAGDVDVLVDPEVADRVVRGLLGRGFVDAGFREGVHQLPTLFGPDGVKVEVHRHIPGLRVLGEKEPATVAALRGAEALEPVVAGPESGSLEWLVPVREVLLAHAIVHGIAQHGFKPLGYPLFRMVADLVMLGASAEDCASVHRWIAAEVSETETRAALVLARRLADGDESLFTPTTTPPPEGVLLRHLVATLVDDEYVSSLRLRWPGSFGVRRGPASLARTAWHAVALTDSQIDIVYGPQRSRWGYLARRLARPFDLLRRAARYGASRLRLHLRRWRGRA